MRLARGVPAGSQLLCAACLLACAPLGGGDSSRRVSARLALGDDVHALAVVANDNATVAELGSLAARKLAKKLKLGAEVVLSELESEGDWLDPDDRVGALGLTSVDGTVLGLANGGEAGGMAHAMRTEQWAAFSDDDAHWLNDVASKYGMWCSAGGGSSVDSAAGGSAAAAGAGGAEAVLIELAREPSPQPEPVTAGFWADEAMGILEQLRTEGTLESEDHIESSPTETATAMGDWLSAALDDVASLSEEWETLELDEWETLELDEHDEQEPQPAQPVAPAEPAPQGAEAIETGAQQQSESAQPEEELTFDSGQQAKLAALHGMMAEPAAQEGQCAGDGVPAAARAAMDQRVPMARHDASTTALQDGKQALPVVWVPNAKVDDYRRQGFRTLDSFFSDRGLPKPRQQQQHPVPPDATIATNEIGMDFETSRDMARRAAEAIKCNTCLFLLQDLWSKVIGVGANDPQSQAIHRSTFSTENDIMAAVEKMCGTIASPAPFRGAYLVEEAKDCSDHPLPGCGHNGFSMRRRHPVLPANVIPNSWRTEALKLACVDLANNLDVEIAEKFYSLAKGSAHYTLSAEEVVAIRLREKETIVDLCSDRCSGLVIRTGGGTPYEPPPPPPAPPFDISGAAERMRKAEMGVGKAEAQARRKAAATAARVKVHAAKELL